MTDLESDKNGSSGMKVTQQKILYANEEGKNM